MRTVPPPGSPLRIFNDIERGSWSALLASCCLSASYSGREGLRQLSVANQKKINSVQVCSLV